MFRQNDTKTNFLFVTVITGMYLWTFIGGVLHTILSLDPDGINPEVMVYIFTLRPIIALVCMGLIFGLAVSLVFLLGALQRRMAVIGGFLLVGVLLGLSQGYLIGTYIWGYVQSGISLQPLTFRLFLGGWIGLIIFSLTIRLRKGFVVRPLGTLPVPDHWRIALLELDSNLPILVAIAGVMGLLCMIILFIYSILFG